MHLLRGAGARDDVEYSLFQPPKFLACGHDFRHGAAEPEL